MKTRDVIGVFISKAWADIVNPGQILEGHVYTRGESMITIGTLGAENGCP